MSAILKGLLQPAIQGVLTSVATPGPASPQPDPMIAQAVLADKLSTAIATAVQQYLTNNVTTQPTITQVGYGPVSHPHNILPIKLIAP